MLFRYENWTYKNNAFIILIVYQRNRIKKVTKGEKVDLVSEIFIMSDHIITDGHTKSFKFGSIIL